MLTEKSVFLKFFVRIFPEKHHKPFDDIHNEVIIDLTQLDATIWTQHDTNSPWKKKWTLV